MLQKTLRYSIIAGIFCIPIIPFIIAPSLFFPFITGKNFTFRIIVEIILALYLVLALKNEEYRPKHTWIFYSLFALLVVLVVSTLTSVNSYRSFWSDFERMEGLIGYLHIFAFFLVSATVLAAKRLWHRFFAANIGASVLMALYCLLQLGGTLVINQGGVRVDGTFGNATYLAIYMVFNVFFVLYFFVNRVEKESIRSAWPITLGGGVLAAIILGIAGQYYFWVASLRAHPVVSTFLGIVAASVVLFLSTNFFKDRVRLVSAFLVTAGVLQLYVIYHTATRSAILGLLGGLALTALLLALSRQSKPILRKTSMVAIGLIAVVVIGLFGLRNTTFVKENTVLSRFATLSFSEQTTESRLLIWRLSLRGAAEKPLLGWGLENYNVVFNKNYDPALYRQEAWFDRAHNTPIDWLVMTGTLGFAAQLAFFIVALVSLWKIKPEDLSYSAKTVFTGLLVAYFFNNLFVFNDLMSSIFYYGIVAYIYTLYASSKKPLWSSRVPNVVLGTSAIVVFAALVFGIYQLNVKPIKAGRELIRAMQIREQISQLPAAQKDAAAEQVYSLFEHSLSLGTFASMETREQLAQSAYILKEQISKDMATKFYTLTTAELEKQLIENPLDARAYQLAGSYVRQYGDYDKALEYLNKALELSPRKQPILYEITSTYLDTGDLTNALRTAKQAFDSAPGSREARTVYGAVLIYTKDLIAAEEILAPIGGLYLFDDRIITSYAHIGRFDLIVRIWEEKIKQSPAVLDYRLRLMATYLQAKNTVKAIAVLEQTIKDFPEFKAQGEAYIAQIRSGQIR